MADEPTTPEQAVPEAAAPAEPAAPAATTTAPIGDGPWANDLAQLFQDEAVRGQVDQYLRSKVQPHITQLEQKAAANADAERLWGALNENPLDAYVQITNEMFGEEAASQLLATLQNIEQQQPEVQQQGQQLDPRLAAAVDFVEQQQAQQYYDAELARVQSEHADLDAELFHPFVAAADGDFNQAYELYSGWLAQYSEKHGTTPEPMVPDAPPVVGSSEATAGTSTAPVEPKYESLDDAINDFMAENRAAREAPPVGGV